MSKLYIKANNINISKLLFNNEMVLMLLIIPFFKSSGFDSIPFLSTVCNVLLALEAAFFGTIVIIKKRISPFGVMICLYGLWVYVICPMVTNYSVPSFFYIAGAIGIISLIELGADQNYIVLLKSFRDVFLFFVTLNLLIVILVPNGLDGNGCYLLGIRTGFSLFIIPGLLVALLYDFVNEKYCSKQTIMLIVVSVITLAYKWVATGLLELVIIGITIISFLHKRIQKANAIVMAILTMVLNYLIVYKGLVSEILKWVVEKFLKKDMTFSGRILIWEAFRKEIALNPIWGYGAKNSIVVEDLLVTKPSHNQWLFYLHEGGYVGCGLIVIGIFISLGLLNKYKELSIYKILFAVIFAIMIAFITEIQTYSPFIYGIFEIPFIIKMIDKTRETRKNCGKGKQCDG